MGCVFMKPKNKDVKPDPAALQEFLYKQYAAMSLGDLVEMRDNLATQIAMIESIIVDKSSGQEVG